MIEWRQNCVKHANHGNVAIFSGMIQQHDQLYTYREYRGNLSVCGKRCMLGAIVIACQLSSHDRETNVLCYIITIAKILVSRSWELNLHAMTIAPIVWCLPHTLRLPWHFLCVRYSCILAFHLNCNITQCSARLALVHNLRIKKLLLIAIVLVLISHVQFDWAKDGTGNGIHSRILMSVKVRLTRCYAWWSANDVLLVNDVIPWWYK